MFALNARARFGPFAFVFPQLCRRKGAAAGAASPARKCASHQVCPLTRLRLVGAHRQDQLAPALRTLTLCHSPHQRIGRRSTTSWNLLSTPLSYYGTDISTQI
jgi:hypothetical protein